VDDGLIIESFLHNKSFKSRRNMMKKKVLTILSEWGYWAEELVGPLYHMDNAGFEVNFATPKGGKPRALPPSLNAGFIDPPLGRSVTSEEDANRGREIEESDRLDNPINLSTWLPERPYTSDPLYLRKLEDYNDALDRVQEELQNYDALLIVGGSGPMIDMVNNSRVHDLILSFLKMDKLIAAECYGVPCLAFARDWIDRQSIIRGKHVTGHVLEYDWKDGTGFIGADINVGPAFYPLEFILRDATGPDGGFHGGFGKRTSVVLDYPFLTSRSTASSYLCGEMIVKILTAEGDELDDYKTNWRIC
jgi:putative intracellular protease/amidase